MSRDLMLSSIQNNNITPMISQDKININHDVKKSRTKYIQNKLQFRQSNLD